MQTNFEDDQPINVVFPLMFGIFATFCLGLVFSGTFLGGSIDQLIVMFVILALIFALFGLTIIRAHFMKVSINDKGIVSVWGGNFSFKFFTSKKNSFWLVPSESPQWQFEFTKSNVKSVRRLKKNELDLKRAFFSTKPYPIEQTFVRSNEKGVCVEFKQPLKFSPLFDFLGGLGVAKRNPLDKLYLSVKNPEELIKALKK